MSDNTRDVHTKRRRQKKQNDNSAVTQSSGDVWADLDVKLSPIDHLKNSIAREISCMIDVKKLTQNEAAKILGTDQAKISKITRGRLDDFSVERLFGFLTELGLDVDIHLSDSRTLSGNVTVHHRRAVGG